MKIRVYVTADAKDSYLFDNIDQVKDGTNELGSTANRKLVLMRKTGKEEGSRDYYKTIAVFNVWMFWREVELTKEIEPISVDQNTKDRLKKFSDKDLSKLFDLLSDVGAYDKENGGLYIYGLMLYVNDEINSRKHKPDKDAIYR